MADPHPADTPATSARTSVVIADALAVNRDGASFADAAADLFSREYDRAEGRLADMLASGAAVTAGATVTSGATADSSPTDVAVAAPASVATGRLGATDAAAGAPAATSRTSRRRRGTGPTPPARRRARPAAAAVATAAGVAPRRRPRTKRRRTDPSATAGDASGGGSDPAASGGAVDTAADGSGTGRNRIAMIGLTPKSAFLLREARVRNKAQGRRCRRRGPGRARDLILRARTRRLDHRHGRGRVSRH